MLRMAFFAVALGLAAPVGATCPSFISEELIYSWGSPTAKGDWHGEELHEPRSLQVLGFAVSYVVVDHDDNYLKLWLRLAGRNRGSGEPLPSSLRNAFAQAYPQMNCSQLGASCYSNMDRDGVPLHLQNAELMDEDPPYGDWHGNGAAKIAADKALGDKGVGPIYLFCEYEYEED